MNDFNIAIITLGEISRDTERDIRQIYDDDLDDITSIFSDICEVMSKQSSIQFVISGFGQNKWPLDVATDLLCAVEELGEIVTGLVAESYDFELDLYEQGVERTLKFSSSGELVKVDCISRTHWRPKPISITLKKSEVKRLFFELKFIFCWLAENVCPELSSHKWFQDWAKSSPVIQ